MTVRELEQSSALTDFSACFRLIVSYRMPMQVEKKLFPIEDNAKFWRKPGLKICRGLPAQHRPMKKHPGRSRYVHILLSRLWFLKKQKYCHHITTVLHIWVKEVYSHEHDNSMQAGAISSPSAKTKITSLQ